MTPPSDAAYSTTGCPAGGWGLCTTSAVMEDQRACTSVCAGQHCRSVLVRHDRTWRAALRTLSIHMVRVASRPGGCRHQDAGGAGAQGPAHGALPAVPAGRRRPAGCGCPVWRQCACKPWGATAMLRAPVLQDAAVTLLAARSASQSDAAVVGRSTALEKEYLRLTSMPTLDAVRPPAVLGQALRMVQRHWLQVGGTAPHSSMERLRRVFSCMLTGRHWGLARAGGRLRLCLRAAEVHPAGPDRAAHPHGAQRAGVRDARPHRCGRGCCACADCHACGPQGE